MRSRCRSGSLPKNYVQGIDAQKLDFDLRAFIGLITSVGVVLGVARYEASRAFLLLMVLVIGLIAAPIVTLAYATTRVDEHGSRWPLIFSLICAATAVAVVAYELASTT